MKRISRKTISFIAVIMLVFIIFSWTPMNVSADQITIYVDDDNTSGTEDGSEANPYNTIQEGIDAASSGDTGLPDDDDLPF